MTNVLYVANSGHLLGGGEVSLYHLVKGLDRNEFRPIVICPENGSLVEAFRKINVHPIIMPLPTFRTLRPLETLKTILRLVRIVKRFRIGCIHSNGSRGSIYSCIVRLLTGVPLLTHFRVIASDGLVDRFIATIASKVLVVSKAAAKRFSWLAAEKKQIIYNGVDTKLFRPENPDRFTRDRFDLNGSDLTIGAVGRISPEKGLEVLLEAMAQIQQNVVKTTLVFFGEGDKQYALKLKRYISDKELENVIFAGFNPEAERIYPLIDILCLSSFTEAFNRSVIEAMSCGIPVVATNVGGNPEAVIDDITGYLVPPNNSKELADAVVKLASQKEIRDRMGKQGRARVRQYFSIETNIQKTQAEYLKLLRQPT